MATHDSLVWRMSNRQAQALAYIKLRETATRLRLDAAVYNCRVGNGLYTLIVAPVGAALPPQVERANVRDGRIITDFPTAFLEALRARHEDMLDEAPVTGDFFVERHWPDGTGPRFNRQETES